MAYYKILHPKYRGWMTAATQAPDVVVTPVRKHEWSWLKFRTVTTLGYGVVAKERGGTHGDLCWSLVAWFPDRENAVHLLETMEAAR